MGTIRHCHLIHRRRCTFEKHAQHGGSAGGLHSLSVSTLPVFDQTLPVCYYPLPPTGAGYVRAYNDLADLALAATSDAELLGGLARRIYLLLLLTTYYLLLTMYYVLLTTY